MNAVELKQGISIIAIVLITTIGLTGCAHHSFNRGTALNNPPVMTTEEALLQSLKANPRLWKSHNLLGMLYNSQGRLEEAIAEYHAAISIMPEQAALFNNLGVSYLLNRDYEKAAEVFTKALKFTPNSPKVFNNLGLALCAQGKYEKGLEVFKKGGTEARAYNNLGCVYLHQGKYQKAADVFEKAMDTNPAYYLKAEKNLENASAARESQTEKE